MKLILILFSITALTSNLMSMNPPNDPIQAEIWYETMRNRVNIDLPDEKDHEKVLRLSEYISRLGRKIPHESDKNWTDLFSSVQNKLMEVPNYAKFLTDDLITDRNRLNGLPMNSAGWFAYHAKRHRYISETLAHLPSPESILALGDFLADRQDLPSVTGGDSADFPNNSALAAQALSNIGLRNAPIPPGFVVFGEDVSSPPELSIWFAKVRAGDLTFSFRGQKVEYRFKPNGTWDTIAMTNPPDDGSARTEATPASPPRESKNVDIRNTPVQVGWVLDFRWLWAAAGVLILVLGWNWKKRNTI